MFSTPMSAVGHVRDVERQPLLAAGRAAGVAPHQHRAGLRERERHHRERDAGDAQGEGADGRREQDPRDEGHHDRAEEDELARPLDRREGVERDAEAVCARREVQRVPERQHPGEPEQHAIARRERREDHAEASSCSVPGM